MLGVLPTTERETVSATRHDAHGLTGDGTCSGRRLSKGRTIRRIRDG